MTTDTLQAVQKLW